MSDTSTLGPTSVDDLALDGPTAAPRSNGELVFSAPWEGRAFGLAVSLADDGAFTMSDFQAELIIAIAEWDALDRPVEEYHYYECWLVALERLVAARTPIDASDIDERSSEYLDRPAGHDHGHDHDHDHGH